MLLVQAGGTLQPAAYPFSGAGPIRPARLTELLRTRDPATLDAVVRENMDILFRAASAAGYSSDDSADLVQETLLVFVRRCAEYDGRASTRTWLFGILINKMRERRRVSFRESSFDAIDEVVENRFDASGSWSKPPEAPDSYAATRQAIDWLESCLAKLPEQRRIAFFLNEVEQLSYGEICTILDVSSNNLGVLMFRARNALRECLEAKGLHGSADVDM